jgi:hypothetical protein
MAAESCYRPSDAATAAAWAAKTCNGSPNSSSYPPSGAPFGEGLGAQQITDLQKAADSGHQPWRLDRLHVAKTFVQSRFGWTSVQTSGSAPTIVFVTNSDGGKVALNLSQPVWASPLIVKTSL